MHWFWILDWLNYCVFTCTVDDSAHLINILVYLSFFVDLFLLPKQWTQFVVFCFYFKKQCNPRLGHKSWRALVLFCRYTYRPQEKTVFAVLLQWPDKGSVVLTEPVAVAGVTKVRRSTPELLLLGFTSVWFLSPGTGGAPGFRGSAVAGHEAQRPAGRSALAVRQPDALWVGLDPQADRRHLKDGRAITPDRKVGFQRA